MTMGESGPKNANGESVDPSVEAGLDALVDCLIEVWLREERGNA